MRQFKTYTLIIVLCLVFLLGCKQSLGENNGKNKSNSNDKLNVIETENMLVELRHPGLTKFNDEVNITFLRELSDGLLELTSHLPDETINNNRWTQLYKNELGINVKYDWTNKGQYYSQQLNYAITSGNISDVIRVNAEQLRLLNNAGLIQDLSEVFEKYATPFTKNILSEDAIDTFDVATINGKLMALPEPDFPFDRANFIWLRTDWLQRLNLEPPQNIEDVKEIARAFTELDPDRNGVNDTYGLAVTSYLWDPVMGVQAFMAGYDAFPELWVENAETGLLEYGGIQPKVKEALLSLQSLYREGIIDEEFSLKNGAKVKESIRDNKIGMFYGEQWGSFNAQVSKETDPDSEWGVFPIVGDGINKVSVPLKFAPNIFYAVSKNYNHPEALIKMYNLHLEKNWGSEANYEMYYSNPYPVWQLSPVTPYPARKNYNAYLQIKEARELKDYSKLDPEAKNIQMLIDIYLNGGTNSDSGWGWNLTYGESSAFSIMDDYVKNNQLKYDEFSGTRTETMIQVQSILNDLQHDTYTKIILGDPIEQFDEFVKKWYSLGGTQMTKEVNEWYKSR